MCRILRVWKLKTSINTSHLLDFKPQEVPTLTTLRPRVGPLKQTKHPRIRGFTCLEGSGRLKMSYCTRLEAQNVDKYFTFVRF